MVTPGSWCLNWGSWPRWTPPGDGTGTPPLQPRAARRGLQPPLLPSVTRRVVAEGRCAPDEAGTSLTEKASRFSLPSCHLGDSRLRPGVSSRTSKCQGWTAGVQWEATSHLGTLSLDREGQAQTEGAALPELRLWGPDLFQFSLGALGLSWGLRVQQRAFSASLNTLGGGRQNGRAGCPLPQTIWPLTCPVSA